MDSPIIHDIIIVGAGPCGLAVAARLCEHMPAALFTDDEHHRFHWIKKHGSGVGTRNGKNGKLFQPAKQEAARPPRTLVLDASADEWLDRWNTLFKTVEIKQLRSPMFFHVDPADRDGLLSFAHGQGRGQELVEISGCVGKEVSKHQKKKRVKGKRPANEANINEREKQDYFTPSTELFTEHCHCIVDRYQLREGLVQKASLRDISYSYLPEVDSLRPLFTLTTDSGCLYARTAVLAVGAGNFPAVPPSMGARAGRFANDTHGQMHAMQIKEFPHSSISKKMQRQQCTNVLVIGGGLTSAQLSDLSIRRGVTKVWHFMRGPCKVKPFDVDLSWMGKWRNVEQAAFWLADTDEERVDLIKKARGGGSITPPFHKILQQHITTGKLGLHTHTTIKSKVYDHMTETWAIEAEPPIPDLPRIDYIYYATGVQTDFATLPYLQTLLKSHPIHGHGGLPCLTDDLTWREDVPLFVTGKLASLRLGPAGGNLGGARAGAERIAWSIANYLKSDEPICEEQNSSRGALLDYASARGNRYARLSEEN